MQGGGRSRGVAPFVAVVCLVLSGTHATWAYFSGSVAASPSRIDAARFAGTIGSTISVARVDGAFVLTWPTVLLDDSRPTESRIVRNGSDGSVVEVCTGPQAPVHGDGVDTCRDEGAVPNVSYTYSQQPVLRSNGLVTWSIPPGPMSVATRVPRLSFGGAGQLVTINSSSALVVPHPATTAVGDVLVLVVRSARNRSVTLPSGWSQLVSTGAAGVGDLLVAWRIADGSGSVSVQTNTNGTGAAAQVLRYVRSAGYSGLPRSAVTVVLSGSSAAATTWTMPGSIQVTADDSTVVSIGTVVGANALTIAGGSPFSVRSATSATSQSNGFGIGAADAPSVDTGAIVQPPTWEQSGVPGSWMGALVAFA